jgi:hypothetical protein
MADPTLEYEKNLPGLVGDLDSALKTQSSGNSSALEGYMQYLKGRQSGQGEVNLPLMAFAAGLGKPTRTGSFAESLSQGLESTMPAIQKGREESDARSADLMKIGMAKNGLAAELAAKRLEVAKLPLAAQGDINKTLGDVADIKYMRGGQQPAGGVQQTIRQGAGAGASNVPIPTPAPPGQSAAAAPGQTTPSMVMPPLASLAPPGQTGEAPPVIPGPQQAMQLPAEAGAPPAAAAPAPVAQRPTDDEITTGALNISPKVDLTAAVGAENAPKPDKDYFPNNKVDLGGGIVGVRPTRAIANQLNAANQISQYRNQNRGSARAGADAAKAEEYLKLYREKGYEWDVPSQTLVPVGAQDPATAARLKYATQAAEEQAKAERDVQTVPQPGTNGLGPGIATTREAVVQATRDADGNVVMKPSPRNEALMKDLPKYEETVRAAAEVLPQNKVAINHIKDLFSKYEPGTWADHKADIEGAFRSMGVDTSGWASDMSAGAYQQVVKGAIDQVFKRVQEIGGRVLASEIIGLGKAVFDPNLSPEANRELVATIAASNDYAAKYVKDYNEWRAANEYDPDVTKFRIQWAAKPENDFQAFKNKNVTDTVVKGARPIDDKYFNPPPLEQRVPGMRINSPSSGVVEWKVEGDKAGWVPVKK